MRFRLAVRHPLSGFTLLELLLVVTVIAVTAAIAIPRFLQTRKLSWETAAIGYLKAISTAQQQYLVREGVYCDSDVRLVEEGMIPGHIVEGENEMGGYTFVVDSFGDVYWFGYAVPLEPGLTGDRFFFIDASGVLRFSEEGIPDEQSPPLD